MLSCVWLFVTVCSPSGSSVHGVFQAGILEWDAISYSRGSSWPRDQYCISCIGKWILYCCASWEAPILHWIFVKRPRSDMPICICFQTYEHWKSLVINLVWHLFKQNWSPGRWSCSVFLIGSIQWRVSFSELYFSLILRKALVSGSPLWFHLGQAGWPTMPSWIFWNRIGSMSCHLSEILDMFSK